MHKNDTIAITGAAGFIGSCLVAHLNQMGYFNLILVDDFSIKEKATNLLGKKYHLKVHRDQFMDWCDKHPNQIKGIFHLGARTDTTLREPEVFKKLNLAYSKAIWTYCTENNIPLVYASSAATYGDGGQGYRDEESELTSLKPMNPYAVSKNDFDIWALEQKRKPPFWAGLKFFNVYGPNEYHKGRMASVIFHAYNQIKANGKVRLFRSHRPEFKDGEQKRDFIYVKDVVKVCVWMMKKHPASGIYNVGTGAARSFNDLAEAIFKSIRKNTVIEYIDTPEDIRESYQYFTEADMQKLKAAGYDTPFTSLEKGVSEYVRKYLEQVDYY
jgi:ADP-L-glycero-D-manno-heptose 6-epimerase